MGIRYVTATMTCNGKEYVAKMAVPSGDPRVMSKIQAQLLLSLSTQIIIDADITVSIEHK